MAREWIELTSSEEQLRKLFVTDRAAAVARNDSFLLPAAGAVDIANAGTEVWIEKKREPVEAMPAAEAWQQALYLEAKIQQSSGRAKAMAQRKADEARAEAQRLEDAETGGGQRVAVLMPSEFGRGGVAWVDSGVFNRRWGALTRETLCGLDWSNVLAAGGSVLACLVEERMLRLFSDGDVDLFIHGLDPAAATAKLMQIVELVTANTGASDLVVTPHSVTILGLAPHPPIQIVLRCYSCPAEVRRSPDPVESGALLRNSSQELPSPEALADFDVLTLMLLYTYHPHATTTTNGHNTDR